MAKTPQKAEHRENGVELKKQITELETKIAELEAELNRLTQIEVEPVCEECEAWKARAIDARKRREAWDKLVKAFKAIGLSIPRDLDL